MRDLAMLSFQIYLGCEAVIFLLVLRLYVVHTWQERRAAAVPARREGR